MVDLMGKKNYYFAISLIVILAGVIGLIVNGVQLDIQFQGGTIMQIEMPNDMFDADRAATIVFDVIGKSAKVQKSSTFNAENSDKKLNLMVLNIASQETLNDVERKTVIDALRTEFGIKEDAEITVNSVEPFIGDEIKKNALYSIFWSSLLIVLYVWWRFRTMHGLSAGVFAVVALMHDVFVMFTVYALFKIPLNDLFVAAVLTIIGYSINDTVIIYDRIRENSRLFRKMPIRELVNKSLLQTMSRSVNTALTTLISIMTLYIFAVVFNIQSIREFSLPLVVGIISGVYSSVFIASTLFMLWQERAIRKKAAARKPAKT